LIYSIKFICNDNKMKSNHLFHPAENWLKPNLKTIEIYI
jgi:hypothetical protein